MQNEGFSEQSSFSALLDNDCGRGNPACQTVGFPDCQFQYLFLLKSMFRLLLFFKYFWCVQRKVLLCSNRKGGKFLKKKKKLKQKVINSHFNMILKEIL